MEKKVLQLRLPAELHGRLAEAKGSRSLNAEIVARLEQSFNVQIDLPDPDARKIPSLAPFTAAVMEAETPSKVFESERPRAGRRTMVCAHRVPVTAFCSRCD